MNSKLNSNAKQVELLKQLNESKQSLANDPHVQMETKLPGDKIQLILVVNTQEKDKVFNALKLKSGGSTPNSAAVAGNKRKASDEAADAIKFIQEAAQAKQKKADSDVEKRKAEMNAKMAAAKENKKKAERKAELNKITSDDNYDKFQNYYEQDQEEIDLKKAENNESYYNEIKTAYDSWKENIEPTYMEEAADDSIEFDENNISTWDEDKKMEYLTEMNNMEPAEQLDKLQEDPVLFNSNWSIGHFAQWLAEGSEETTDSTQDRNSKPFPGITEIDGAPFDPETLEMTPDKMQIWFHFVQTLYPEDYDDITLTYKDD